MGARFATTRWRAPPQTIARKRRTGRVSIAHARNLAPRGHKR